MRFPRFLVLAAAAVALIGQRKFDLTIDNIMRGPELTGYEPAQVRWSGDSQRVYFRWKLAADPRDKDPDTYVVNRDGTGLRKLTEDEARLAPPVAGDRTRDRRRIIYNQRGDIYIYDFDTDTVRQLTKTSDNEGDPRFLADGKRISFTRANNLYVMSLETGLLEQVTDIRAAGAATAAPAGFTGFGGGRGQGQGFGRGGGPPTAATGDTQERRGTESQEFLKKEERELLEVIRDRARRREEQEAKNKKEQPRKPFQLQQRQSIGRLELTPGEKNVIAVVMESTEGSKQTIVPSFVTESAYTESLNARAKVGDSQSRMRLAILSTETGEVKWVDHGQKEAAPPAPERKSDGGGEITGPPRGRPPAGPADRAITMSAVAWSDDGKRAAMLGRATDNKDRWVFALDVESGKARVLFTLRDEAWVGGPGAQTLGWIDNETLYFQAERDGWSHLYAVKHEGGEPRQLTSGKWEVTDVELSRDKSLFYLTTSEEHLGERHLYSMPVSGGPRTKITRAPGNNQAVLSPDEKSLAVVYSYSNRPPELFIAGNRPGAEPKKVTTSPAPEFFAYAWTDPPIVHIPARDGAQVPARMYKPKNWKAGGAAVMFVHGAGYLQNAHRWWSSYSREYMFHHLLMERGFLVLDVDYRGSAGYGRDWRTAIYRHMGGKDLDDHVDAARWLVAQHGVNPKKIGLYGGSYGGFITLMAMFTQPDVFAAGAALRPVTDWAHYNHGYTSNILNIPQQDAEAYKKSSPIYHAAGLKGALLICHGMVDVNVHFQDTVRLVQKLIELRKENWELAVYPVEDHAFVQPSSWADEYKRILKLFESNLR
jgi:dipeptidyl aminopeptidase/acylaminoacyl peptidase